MNEVIETMTQPVLIGIPLDRILNSTLIALLKAQPANPQVRTLIYAQTNLMLPSECDTFERCADWLGKNYAPPAPPPVDNISLPPTGPASPEALRVDVEVTEDVRGSCSFRRTDVGVETVSLTVDELRNIARNADSLDDFTTEVRLAIEQEAYSGVELEPGDETYDDQSTDDSDRECSYRLRDSDILNALREHCPTEYQELQGEN